FLRRIIARRMQFRRSEAYHRARGLCRRLLLVEQHVQEHLELLGRDRALDPHSVDEEAGRRADSELPPRDPPEADPTRPPVLVVTGREPLRVEPELRRVAEEEFARLARGLPLPLPLVEPVVHRPEFALALLARALAGPGRLRAVREDPQDVRHVLPGDLAGLDVPLVQLGVRFPREHPAVRAPEVAELDDLDGRVRIAPV